MFRLSSLGHHQVVSLYRGHYTAYGMIQYVNIKIIMIQRDVVFVYRQNETSLNHNNFNVYVLYYSIYCRVSSITTYDLMMAQ